MMNIAVVGAGLMGRLAAVEFARSGYKVTLFDKDAKHPCGEIGSAASSAASVAAGLLTPLGESLCSPDWVVEMGFDALKLWPKLLASLERPVFFQHNGSLLVAHQQDSGDMQRFGRHIAQHWPQYPGQWLQGEQMVQLEPQLATRFNQGLYLPQEGQINPRDLMQALAFELEKLGVNWLYGHCVEQIQPRQIFVNGDHLSFDWVIDCRGIGAASELTDLRGVRGEVFELHAPEVSLNRPIRLMHPRYHLYIAPKQNQHFMVGATEIESDNGGPMSVRSALELLSAVYSVHSGFAEASILASLTGCRPAFANNHPQIHYQDGLIRVNGLYRHGFLLAPVVLEHLIGLFNQLNQAANPLSYKYPQLMCQQEPK